MTVRVAVVGTGVMGRRYLQILPSLPGVVVVGWADPDPQAQHAAGQLTDAPGFAEMDSLLDATQPDAVVVATPDAAHGSAVRAALARRCAVLVEKPLATRVDEAEELCAAARAAGVPAMVAHILRWDDRYHAARRTVQGGGLGKILYVSAYRYASRAGMARGSRHPVWHLGIHDIDAIRWITGQEFRRVGGAAASVATEAGAMTVMTAHAVLSDGSVATLQMGGTLPAPFEGHVWSGLHIAGTRGVLEIPSTYSALTVFGTEGVAYTDPTRFYLRDTEPSGSLVREVAAFVAAVRAGRPSPVPFEEALAAARVAAAIERACQSGESAEVLAAEAGR